MWLAGAALVAALPGAAFAQQSEAESKGVFSLVVENDSLSSGADRNYTSGVKLAYVSPAERVPRWLRSTGGFTRAISNSEPDFWGISIGQSIFTPEDINAVPAPPDEHPYAGWLYMQIMVSAEEDRTDGRRPRFLDSYELEHPQLLGQIVDLVSSKFMPIITRHALSGRAHVNSDDPIFN